MLAHSPLHFNRTYLKTHITRGRFVNNRIKGAHKDKAFFGILNRHHGRCRLIRNSPHISGVRKVRYNFQDASDVKVIYNPRQFSTDNYLKRGIQAIRNVRHAIPGANTTDSVDYNNTPWTIRYTDNIVRSFNPKV